MTMCKLFHLHNDQANLATTKTLLRTKVTSTRILSILSPVLWTMANGTSHLEMSVCSKHVRTTEQQVTRSILARD